MFDFDEIYTNKSENVCSFCDYFIIFLESIDFKYSQLNTNLNFMFSKVLSLYCLPDVQNLVLCLTCERLKSLYNKAMLKSQCKTTSKHALFVNISSKSDKNSPVLKKMSFYMKYTLTHYSDRILFARLCAWSFLKWFHAGISKITDHINRKILRCGINVHETTVRIKKENTKISYREGLIGTELGLMQSVK